MKLALISPYYTNQPSGANVRFESISEVCGRLLGSDLLVVTCKGFGVKGVGRVLHIPFNLESGLIGRFGVYVWLNFFQLYCLFKGVKVITDFNPVTIPQFFSSNQYQLIHDARVFSEFGRWGEREKAIMTFFWKKLKNIITVSHASKTEFINHLGIAPEKVIVSYNGVDSIPSKLIADKDIDILYVSTFEKRKNHIKLLQALLLIEDRLKVVFVGYDNGEKIQIDQFIADNEFIHSIEFLSGVTSDELSAIYSRTKVFVFPSLYEGFGMPLIEAASNGVRVSCSNLPVFEEVMDDYASYFDPNNSEDMAECILTELASASKLKDSFDLSRFNWGEISRMLLKDIHL